MGLSKPLFRTPAQAGVQLGDVGNEPKNLSNWTPAFAGVRAGVIRKGFANAGLRRDWNAHGAIR